MAPNIPSPTPIKGVQNPDGSPAPPGPRLPIAELQQHEFAFALYAQALLDWQRDGDEEKDANAAEGTSYFQVTGVHGIPYVQWQNDPTPGVVDNYGYCTHSSVLFVPWHRPYLMLYEQIVYQYALAIVNRSTGYAKEAYQAVLEYVRLPFWDFNKDPSLPEAVKTKTLNITIPGESKGDKETKSLDPNPFYSYKFTSDYAWKLVSTRSGWNQHEPKNWYESKRCPDAKGESQQEIANEQVKNVGKLYKQRAYSLLTSVHNFAEFTCNAWQSDTNFDSIESWHNGVHNHTGTRDVGNHGKYPQGNLTDVQVSSFDPLFWLLHCHIDRITAIWQAMNYKQIDIDNLASRDSRFTAQEGTLEGGASHLEPWHNSAGHNKEDYWIADATKDLESTFVGGYYYPETPLDLRNNHAAMEEQATKQVTNLYAPSRVKNLIHKLAPASAAAAPAGFAAAEEAPPEEPDLDATKPSVPIDTPMQDVNHPIERAPTTANTSSSPDISVPAPAATSSGDVLEPIQSVEWRAFVRVKRFAVQGTWGIHLFLGEPPAQSSEWFMGDNRIGTVSVLNNENLNACQNCRVQSESDQLVTGIVLLSNELRDRHIDINDRDAVVDFLKEKLTWRIAKDAQNVDITPEMSLTVGVAARDVVYPLSASDLPVWGRAQIFPAATVGKVGGLETDVEEV